MSGTSVHDFATEATDNPQPIRNAAPGPYGRGQAFMPSSNLYNNTYNPNILPDFPNYEPPPVRQYEQMISAWAEPDLYAAPNENFNPTNLSREPSSDLGIYNHEPPSVQRYAQMGSASNTADSVIHFAPIRNLDPPALPQILGPQTASITTLPPNIPKPPKSFLSRVTSLFTDWSRKTPRVSVPASYAQIDEGNSHQPTTSIPLQGIPGPHALNTSMHDIVYSLGGEEDLVRPPIATKASNGYDTSKPTCTINLVCYRSGTHGCEMYQITTAKRNRFTNHDTFIRAMQQIPKPLIDDEGFFLALREAYLNKMCGPWRRIFFLKSLRGIRILSFTPTTRPVPVPLSDITHQEILYAYHNPSKIGPGEAWIDWVFRLRQADRRHALEFVEGWNATRICIAGILPLAISTIVGIVWSVRSSDVQTAFTVAGFILTGGTREVVLALLAIVSGIEASGRTST